MVNGMKTFSKGGVHPAGHKELSNAIAIRNAEVKGTLIFPMSMHIGAPAECLVKVGDEVNEGMLIGKAAGFISANIYCSVKGVVKEIKDIYLASGMKTKAVVVETAEDFKPGEVKFEASDWEKLTPKEIVDKIAAAGIVGLGGATFPVNVKYSIPPDSKVDALVINGVECEPYLTADHRLMLEKTEQLFKGMRIIAKAINAPKIFVGIEANKPDAIQKMTEFAAKNGGDIEIVPLQLKYPQGDEKQLLKAVIDKEIPSGKLPIAIGAVVSNVGTVNAVYEAVALGKPLYERVVTVTGGGIKTTTTAALALLMLSVIRGENEVNVTHRRLPDDITRRALAVAGLFLTTLLAGTLIVSLIEDGRFPLEDILFEASSAMGTVGVSAIGTPNLSPVSRAVLVPMMFLGRVGPLTLAVAVAKRQGRIKSASKYPEERIMIG